MTARDRRRAIAVLLSWGLIAAWIAANAHRSLLTNAFDLSVFDYALWSSLHGRLGFVPFMGHSIFSHHFMPVLGWLLLVYAALPSAGTLIAVQIIAMGASAWLLLRVQEKLGLTPGLALMLTAVYLLARRSYGATFSFFYPECLQPLLVFAVVLAWDRGRWTYWIAAALLLATKEDASIYLASFAAWQAVSGRHRRQAITTMAVSVAWLAFAFLVAMPMSRAHDGLGPGNPLLEARYMHEGGSAAAAGGLVSRLISMPSSRTVFGLIAMTGFLALGGAAWLVPAVPGLAANLVATPGSLQAALIDHYAWAMLPWCFLAASAGLTRLHRRAPRLAIGVAVLLLVATIADSPLVRHLTLRPDADASQALEQLAQLHPGPADIVLAQGNLIPHLDHVPAMFAVGADVQPPRAPDWVILSPVGDLWPLGRDGTERLIATYQSDPSYRQVGAGSVVVFRRPR